MTNRPITAEGIAAAAAKLTAEEIEAAEAICRRADVPATYAARIAAAHKLRTQSREQR